MSEFVNSQVSLPLPQDPSPEGFQNILIQWANALVSQLFSLGRRVNICLTKDGTEPMTGPLPLATYTTATRPAAVSNKGAIIFVSDGAAGSKFQGSDGTTWVSLG